MNRLYSSAAVGATDAAEDGVKSVSATGFQDAFRLAGLENLGSGIANLATGLRSEV